MRDEKRYFASSSEKIMLGKGRESEGLFRKGKKEMKRKEKKKMLIIHLVNVRLYCKAPAIAFEGNSERASVGGWGRRFKSISGEGREVRKSMRSMAI